MLAVGRISIFLAYLKHVTERRRWQRFKQAVNDWVNCIDESENRHPNELSEDGWKALCESMLTDANFSQLEIKQVLEIAVVVGKDIAADRIYT